MERLRKEIEKGEENNGKSRKLISIQTVLNYTLALQKEVEDIKIKSKQRERILSLKIENIEREKEVLNNENDRLIEENSYLKKQLKEVSNQLLKWSNRYKFDRIDGEDSREPRFQFRMNHSKREEPIISSHQNKLHQSAFYPRRDHFDIGNEEQHVRGNFRNYSFRNSFELPQRPQLHSPSTFRRSSMSSQYRRESEEYDHTQRRKNSKRNKVNHSENKKRPQRRHSSAGVAVKVMNKSERNERRGGKYQTIFDKLNDPDLYTGVYAERYRTGKGGINQFTGDKILSLSQILRPGFHNLSYTPSKKR